MARILCYGKIFLSNRGFSTAFGREIGEGKAVLMTGTKKSGEAISDAAASAAPMAWVPDPVTGYYRPANFLGEKDPAELRKVFLKHKD